MKVKPFTEQELDRFLQTVATTGRSKKVRKRNFLIYSILRYTGCRIGEVLRMNLNQLDLESGVWTVPAEHSKNGFEQKVFLLPVLVSLIKKHVEEYSYLFKDGFLCFAIWKCKSKKSDSRHLSPVAWRLTHKIYLQRAGLLEVIGIRKDGRPRYGRNTHSIRSCYAIKCYEKLVVPGLISYMELSKLLRHKNPSSTLHYLNNMNLDQITTQKKYLNKVFQ